MRMEWMMKRCERKAGERDGGKIVVGIREVDEGGSEWWRDGCIIYAETFRASPRFVKTRKDDLIAGA